MTHTLFVSMLFAILSTLVFFLLFREANDGGYEDATGWLAVLGIASASVAVFCGAWLLAVALRG